MYYPYFEIEAVPSIVAVADNVSILGTYFSLTWSSVFYY